MKITAGKAKLRCGDEVTITRAADTASKYVWECVSKDMCWDKDGKFDPSLDGPGNLDIVGMAATEQQDEPATPPSLKIVAGKVRLRNGSIKTIKRIEKPWNVYRWTIVDPRPNIQWKWTETGKYNPALATHDWDIVGIEEPSGSEQNQPTPHNQYPNKPEHESRPVTQLCAGVWEDRRGRRHTITRHQDNAGKWRWVEKHGPMVWNDQGETMVSRGNTTWNLVHFVGKTAPVLPLAKIQLREGIWEDPTGRPHVIKKHPTNEGRWLAVYNSTTWDDQGNVTNGVVDWKLVRFVGETLRLPAPAAEGPTITDTHITIPLSQLGCPETHRVVDIRPATEGELAIATGGVVLMSQVNWLGPRVIVEKIASPEPIEGCVVLFESGLTSVLCGSVSEAELCLSNSRDKGRVVFMKEQVKE